uniref:C-type lectin domain-containing protein n=1 Tax=Myripristis murdjan TaxID=586833 RepID=A0A667WM85_9TELE
MAANDVGDVKESPMHQPLLSPDEPLVVVVLLCSSRWILVEEHKSWSEAQSYCRQSYTDLASIRNLAENEEIRGLISEASWIGLFRDAWKWSDGSTMSFSKWDNSQPSGGDDYHSWIGLFRDGWKWSDGSTMSFSKWDDNHPSGGYARCRSTICSSRWVFVHERKTWSEAQSYCRQSYTDLASIRNLTENEEIRGLISDTSWIGLFRDAWKWSDGSTMSFSKWDNSQSYCRQHYTDLATVTSEEDVTKLNDAVGSYRSWIGLYNDIHSWRWSLQNKSYYGEGEAEFRMWHSGEPNNYYSDEYCVAMNTGGTWGDWSCSDRFPFICYNGENKTTAVNS